MAARQLKWVYPVNADDDEFLKRATLLSTLIVDELSSKAMRRMLQLWDENLRFKDAETRQSLGSRKLLERLMLVAAVIEEVNPSQAKVSSLIEQAEKPDQSSAQARTASSATSGAIRWSLRPIRTRSSSSVRRMPRLFEQLPFITWLEQP